METLCKRIITLVLLITVLESIIPCLYASVEFFDETDEKVDEVLKNLFGEAYSVDSNTNQVKASLPPDLTGLSETSRHLSTYVNVNLQPNKQNLTRSTAPSFHLTKGKFTAQSKQRTGSKTIIQPYDATTKKMQQAMNVSRTKREASDEATPTIVPIELIKDHQMEVMIRRVGAYLRGYKYLGIDYRFHSEKKKKPKKKLVLIERVFMRHFPIPSMRRLHPNVERACEKSFRYCLQEVYHTVERTALFEFIRTGAWEAIKKHLFDMMFDTEETQRKLMNAPFQNALAQFQYQLTASYYMCWYTMQNLPELKGFGRRCDFIGWKFKGKFKIKTIKSKDYRMYDRGPFDCALLSFCPDFCCGGVPGGQPKSESHCNNHKSNPCNKLLEDKTCRHDFRKNHSFRDLIKNRVNITCNCERYQKGFEWSMRFQLCIDRDECFTGNYTCQDPHQICRNTIGGYDCVCKRGYRWDDVENKCVHIPGLATYDIVNASYIARFTDPTPTEDTIAMLEKKAEYVLQSAAKYLGLESKGNSTVFCNDYLTIMLCFIVHYVINIKNKHY